MVASAIAQTRVWSPEKSGYAHNPRPGTHWEENEGEGPRPGRSLARLAKSLFSRAKIEYVGFLRDYPLLAAAGALAAGCAAGVVAGLNRRIPHPGHSPIGRSA